jgi:endoglucanase
MNTPEITKHNAIFFLLILSTLILTNCQPQPPTREELVIPDAFEQNNRLGGGANVGSILYRWDIWDEEREKEELDLLKGLGLKGVRINTRPFLHASEEPPYTLSQEFFDRLDWLVNEALERGFTVIIDEHQYRVMGKDPMGLKNIFLETWRQMAEHYKDYPDNVYFGVLNEPNNNLTPYLWNYLLKDVYKILRESNPARTLVIGPGDWNNIEGLEFFELPEEDHNIIVEIHYYSPHRFTHQGVEGRDTLITWGTTEERKAVENDFNIAAEWAKRNDRPLYLGEFGVNKKADQESAVQWLRFVREQMEKNNMSWAMWNMMGSNFGMYDEEKKEWIEPRKNAVLLLE